MKPSHCAVNGSFNGLAVDCIYVLHFKAEAMGSPGSIGVLNKMLIILLVDLYNSTLIYLGFWILFVI